MLRLLLDSSQNALYVALSRDATIIDWIVDVTPHRQSELLVAKIDELLKRNKIEAHNIEGVVVTKGPGSYTGVRLALTVAKVMSVVLDVPLYLVSTLRSYADKEKTTITLMNARAGRSYFAVYQGKKALIEDCILNNDEVFLFIKEHPDYLLSGDLKYLNLNPSFSLPLIENLALADTEDLCPNSLKAAPVYLKGTASIYGN